MQAVLFVSHEAGGKKRQNRVSRSVEKLSLTEKQNFIICDYIDSHPNLCELLKERGMKALQKKRECRPANSKLNRDPGALQKLEGSGVPWVGISSFSFCWRLRAAGWI
ncbi:hypothetical protein FHS45_001931 [Thalassobacillus devorans]|nr:hypothetical protein [Thalassobacillus devorans]